MRIEADAPAKLNLFLHVTGRRSDGYHLLQSLFIPINWCDHLVFERRGDGKLIRQGANAQVPEDDLSLRAARLLQQESATPLGATITLEKNIPIGAGMGGGSSDAATTLLSLNQLWNLHWPLAKLTPLALRLGADVPFFLYQSSAWVEGIGEQIEPLEVAPLDFLVIKPAASIPTAQIFAHPLLRRDAPPVDRASVLTGLPMQKSVSLQTLAQVLDLQGRFQNDLQAPAIALCEEVRRLLENLQQLVGPGRMTGSGSAVFAPLFTALQRQSAQQYLDLLPPASRGRICQLHLAGCATP
jgi:4-diphosphocytidyl-2-C-methyl-D-erythritol kinase